MPKVITITNEKGGVAKTTTTINLGVGLARHQKKVLLVDCNMQSDLTSCFLGEDEIQSTLADAMIQTMDGSPIEKLDFIHPTKEGVDVIPAEKALIGVESHLVTALSRESILRRFLEQVQEGYDYVLLDCPAGLSQIVINAMVASDGVIIPTEPGADSFSGVYGAVENVRKIKNLLNPSLDVTGILITKADLRTNLHRRFALQIKEMFGPSVPVFRQIIPDRIAVGNSKESRKSIFAYDARSDAAIAYDNLTKEVLSLDAPIKKQSRTR